MGPIHCLYALFDQQCFPALTGALLCDSPLPRLVASQYWDSSARQGLGRSRQALWVCRQALLGQTGMFDLLSSSATDQEKEMHKISICNSAHFGTEQHLHVASPSAFLLFPAL